MKKLNKQKIVFAYKKGLYPSLKSPRTESMEIIKDIFLAKSYILSDSIASRLSFQDIDEVFNLSIPKSSKLVHVEEVSEEEFMQIATEACKDENKYSNIAGVTNLELVLWFLRNDIKFPLPEVSSPEIRKVLIIYRDDYRFSSLSEILRFKSGCRRSERRRIMESLEKIIESSGLESTLAKGRKQKSGWYNLSKHLHPQEYKTRYPKAYEFFDKLQNKKPSEWGREVEEAYKENNIDKIIKLLVQRPTEFVQRFESLLKRCEDSGRDPMLVLDALISTDISRKDILWLHSFYYHRCNHPRNNVKSSNTSKSIQESLLDILGIKFFNNFPEYKENKAVYLDPNLKNILVNRLNWDRIPSTCIDLGSSSEISFSIGTNKKDSSNYDRKFELLLYNSDLEIVRRNSEFLKRKRDDKTFITTIDKEKAKKAGVRYIVCTYNIPFLMYKETITFSFEKFTRYIKDSKVYYAFFDLEKNVFKFIINCIFPRTNGSEHNSLIKFLTFDDRFSVFEVLKHYYGNFVVEKKDKADLVISASDIKEGNYNKLIEDIIYA